jgi:hypothetical protein
MHPKVIVKLKKTLENPLVWAKNPKKTQKTQKTQKKPKKNQKNPLGWVFFKKTRVFSNTALNHIFLRIFTLRWRTRRM